MRDKMVENLFDKLLTVVGIISIIAFLGFAVYIGVSHGGLTPRRFAVAWLLIYVFGATLGFKGNLADRKEGIRRFALLWIFTCAVGALLASVVLVLD
jgi:predicted permease